jgi:Predicted membrane protein
MRIKKFLSLLIVAMLSVTAVAQPGGGFGGGGGMRGGGGSFQGGGGQRGGGQRGGGGFQGGGRGGWGGYATLNDSTELERFSGSLTFVEGRGAGNAIREDDLKQLLDSVQFQRYEIANRKFIKGDNKESIGVMCGIPTAILTLIAVTHYSSNDPGLSKKLYILSGALALPTITFYTWGRLQKGKAKRELERIADEYNKDLPFKKAAKMLQFEFEPTVFIDRHNNSSFGASVNLTF